MDNNKIINRLNKFLENHVFSIQLLPDGESPSFIIDVKLKVTGKKQLISVGEWTDYYTCTIFIEKVGSKLLKDVILKYFDGKKERELETNERDSNLFYSLRRKTDSSLSSLFDYFGVEGRVIATKAVNNLNSANLTESILMEGRYDAVTTELSRQLILAIKKRHKKGKIEFDFPVNKQRKSSEYNDLENVPETKLKFEIKYNKNFDMGFDVYGQADDETIELSMEINPDMLPDLYSEIVPTLKDAIRHELEHVAQNNLERPESEKYEKTPEGDYFKYFTARHEVPAFVRGLYKQAKTRKLPLDVVIDKFMKEYSHTMTIEQSELVKNIWIQYAKRNLPRVKLSVDI